MKVTATTRPADDTTAEAHVIERDVEVYDDIVLDELRASIPEGWVLLGVVVDRD